MSRDLYLGRALDPRGGSAPAGRMLLDADDLTTHGLIVGMTGSGKTALGIVMIEELLLAGVPVLAIDPKGDLGNLLLAFPDLSPAAFAPWVDASSGATGESEARRWTEGLATSELGPADVARLAASKRAVVYTPGSTSGAPLDLLGTCAEPESGDEEDRNDVVAAFVTGLLGLVGIDADPIRSREAILLGLVVRALWARGEVATLEGLVTAASRPPFASVGALPLETFFPAKERQELVLALNGLLASPAMAGFRQGPPLDIAKMLEPPGPGDADRRTPLSIVSIAHLADAERIFVVATLLSRVKAWMRSRPGRPSLGALVYIDEIFGFFPPSAEPPTKKPLLTLLKQARAFGLGVVVATQNPVDLDYKGLANCGCWWVGTLQTERDRKRLEEGLADASGRSDIGALLDATKKRVFLLHDVHRKEPVLLQTRWAMSYLRGPMTRAELGKANAEQGETPARGASEPAAQGASPRAPRSGTARPDSVSPPAPSQAAPSVPAPWISRWVEKRGAEIASPYLFVRYAVRYRVGRASAPEVEGVKLIPLAAPGPGEVFEGDALDVTQDALLEQPSRALRYEPLPEWLGPRSVPAVERAVKGRLPDKLAATLLVDPVTGAIGGPGESPAALSARLGGADRAPAALRDRLERKRRDLAAAEQSEKGRQMETIATGVGAAVDILGGLFGKRKSFRTGKVGSVLSKRRMEGAAENRVAALRAEVAELESKLAPPDPDRFTSVDVVPASAHVDILSIGVAWVA